jgi:hypothetical protein
MTDEEKNEPAQPSNQPPTRSAGAAARRARRIGGRGAQPQQPSGPDHGADAGVGLSKSSAQEPSPSLPPPPPPRVPPAGGQPTVVVAVPAWLRWAPAGVLTAGALVMAILLVTFSHGVWWAKTSGSVQREKVLAAAKTCVAASNSYKYTQLDAFETKALACATGTFRTQLRTTIEKLIKVNAPQLKASQTAQISRGGIETITKSGQQWTVLLFGQLAVTNTNYPKGRTDPFAAQVRMQKVGGKWLMSDLKTVSTPLS